MSGKEIKTYSVQQEAAGFMEKMSMMLRNISTTIYWWEDNDYYFEDGLIFGAQGFKI